MGVLFASWLVNAVTLYILARFLPGINIANLVPPDGFITHAGMKTVLIGGLVIGIFNSIIRPVLKFLCIPLTCLTLGLFSFVISGIVFYLAVWLTPGMTVANFWWAIIGGVCFGVLNSVLSGLLGIKKDEDNDRCK